MVLARAVNECMLEAERLLGFRLVADYGLRVLSALCGSSSPVAVDLAPNTLACASHPVVQCTLRAGLHIYN